MQEISGECRGKKGHHGQSRRQGDDGDLKQNNAGHEFIASMIPRPEEITGRAKMRRQSLQKQRHDTAQQHTENHGRNKFDGELRASRNRQTKLLFGHTQFSFFSHRRAADDQRHDQPQYPKTIRNTVGKRIFVMVGIENPQREDSDVQRQQRARAKKTDALQLKFLFQ